MASILLEGWEHTGTRKGGGEKGEREGDGWRKGQGEEEWRSRKEKRSKTRRR